MRKSFRLARLPGARAEQELHYSQWPLHQEHGNFQECYFLQGASQSGSDLNRKTTRQSIVPARPSSIRRQWHIVVLCSTCECVLPGCFGHERNIKRTLRPHQVICAAPGPN